MDISVALAVAVEFGAFWIGFFTIVACTWFIRQLIFS